MSVEVRPRQRPFPTLLILAALVYLVGCQSLGRSKQPLSASLRTDSTEIGVRHVQSAYVANIGFVFTNTTTSPISTVGCAGLRSPDLEKKVNGRWVTAYHPAYLACLIKPDFFFPSGASHRGVLNFLAYERGLNRGPTLAVDSIPGVYRLRWVFAEGIDATAKGARKVEAISNEFRMTLRTQPPIAPPSRTETSRPTATSRDTARIVASFKDTARTSVTFADAETFQLRTPGQRDALRAILNRQRNLWRARTPGEYQYLLHVDCFCPGRRGWLLIEVRRGNQLHAWDKTGKSVALSDWNTISIDTLFDMLERAVNMDGVVHVAFDPRWHFPANVRTVRLPGPDAWTIIDARGLKPLTKE